MTSLLGQAFIFLCAAVILVPLARRVGLGSVLGYLIAGVVIGPYVLGLVGKSVSDVMHFAEFGVVMMLFLVGLELEPARLWRLRSSILGLGGAQVLLTSALIAVVVYIAGFNWQMAISIGMVMSLSSTAIVLQTIAERDMLKTETGQSAFSVLLFQDIAVIPMLAILPFLAIGIDSATTSNLDWYQAVVVVLVIVGIVVGGQFLVRPVFRIIAEARTREIFTATALLLVVGIALLMDLVGVSAALGTFLAGMVLANSEYKHELETEIQPFKGLLLGLFFISVGASVDFSVILDKPLLIGALVLGLLIVKMIVLFFLARLFHLRTANSLLLSVLLPQGGEFGFVLFSFAQSKGVLSNEVISPLIVVIAITMALTPMLLVINDRFIQPLLFNDKQKKERKSDIIDDGETPVILAGMGRFGQIVARVLTVQGFKVTVLEHDPAQVDLIRKFGNKAFYGEASRMTLLRSAGAESAKLLVVAVDGHDTALEIISRAKVHFPHLSILARATGRGQAHELQKAGADVVVRETFHSALYLGEQALQKLGMRSFEAHRAIKAFNYHDELSMKDLADHWGDETGYILQAQKSNAMLSELMAKDSEDQDSFGHFGWDEVKDNNEHG